MCIQVEKPWVQRKKSHENKERDAVGIKKRSHRHKGREAIGKKEREAMGIKIGK